MVITKTFSKKIIITTIFLLSLIPLFKSSSEDLKWQNYTSFKEVRHMRFIQDTLFLATSGGILAISDFNEPGKEYINLDGLGTNDITDIIEDASGKKWATGFGRLIRFEESDTKQFLFFNIDDKLIPLYRVMDDGNYLWVGTGIGLVLFSKNIDGGQIQDSYQLFDNLNPSPAVYDIFLKNDSIWIATSNGLAVASKTDLSLLKSPTSWRGFNLGKYPELGMDTTINIVSLDSQIFISTTKGVFRLDIDTLSGDTSFIPISIGTDIVVNNISKIHDTLFVFYDDDFKGGMGFILDSTFYTLSINGLPSAPQIGFKDGSNWWVAVVNGGVYNNASGTFQEYLYTGLPDNDISDITVNKEGIITAGFRVKAAATFENNIWHKYNFWIRGGITNIITDSTDRTWIGTLGNGLWLADNGTLTNYDENNSPLRGNTDNPPTGATYVYIDGLVTDGNYLYAACYRALNNYPVVIADLNNLDNPASWDSIGIVNGLNNAFVVDIDCHNGQLAVATEFDGVYLCNVGDDPFHTNITCQHYVRENSLLISNSTRAVKFAPDGTLWVGTNFGLSRFDNGIDRFIDVNLPPDVSSFVTALEFDGRGNLWVGTKNGLVRFDAVTGNYETFNTLNSGIVANDITNITYDKFSGGLYISTTMGFSFTPSPIGRPTYNVANVKVFPNPFVIKNGNERLSFNIGKKGRVRIFNVAGEQIRDMPLQPWDGKNQKGETVASGVYLFVITDDDGNMGKGKILLIRQ